MRFLVVLLPFLVCCGRADGDESLRAKGCGAADLARSPTDPAARGPYAVGLRTLQHAGLTVDVYYPAPAGSRGEPARFDLRDHLPGSTAAALVGEPLPELRCACIRDLPVADGGPYPMVMNFHGRALTRAAWPTLNAHLASRGFVVVAPDLPGANLADIMIGEPGDRIAAVEAFIAARDEIPFLRDRLDARLGLVGHSLGAGVVDDLLDRHGDVGVAISGRGLGSPRPVSKLIMGGELDGFAEFPAQVRGYERSPGRKRLIGVEGAGHMSFADHCSVESNWYGAAQARGANLQGFPEILADRGCVDVKSPAVQTNPIVLAAITAVLEETLICSPTAAASLVDLAERPGVSELRESDG